LNYVDF